jgi:hypothetical protein
MLSCSQHHKDIATIDLNASARPMLHDENISALISDSGVTRIRLEAAVRDIYSSDTASYWYFPEGIYVEQFDSLFQVSGFARAYTPCHFDKTGIWRLLKNVVIKSDAGTTCETSELYWNSKEPASSLQAIYTDKFVTITTPDKTITSAGLKANLSLTNYILYANTLETEIEPDNSPPE